MKHTQDMQYEHHTGSYTCPMHPKVHTHEPGRCPECGMDLVPADEGSSEDSDGPHHHDHASMMASPGAAKDFLRRFFIVTALLIPLALFSAPGMTYVGMPDFAARTYVEFIIATAIFYFGWVFFQHARHEIMMRQYGMMTLVSMGVGAGYLFSALSTFIPSLETEFYLEISTLIWVLLFGHFLEAKSSTAAGDALQEVAALLPKQAHVKRGEETQDVDIEDLKEGDVVVVKPGEKVPADGTVLTGSAHVNEAHISGESKPVSKTQGGEVVAGAIVLDGSLEVKLLRVGESSTIGQIKSLIASARKTKPSAQRLADRAARWLTFSALGVSIITLLVWSLVVQDTIVFSATLAITVLVIACPHALGLAIPTVSTIATKLAVKNGVFVKDMSKIEIIKKASYVVFDKTGTLTHGKFGVTQVNAVSGDEKELLQVAAGIEQFSSHVIGTSIVAYAKEQTINIPKADDVKNIAGKGMGATIAGQTYWVGNARLMQELNLWQEMDTAKGATAVYVASKEKILGVILLSDTIKEEAQQAVDELHALGIQVAMLTGDNKKAAQSVAETLGIDTVFAEVLPQDKYTHIKSLQEKGNVVLMAGDGVNDAPALTQADAGVAIGAGTDIAVEAGDIVLTQSNPEHIVRLIVLAKKVYAKMIQNLWYALGYNVIAIPAAAGIFVPLGFRLTPAVGALLMSLSSVVVVINAMSLRKARLSI